MGTPILISGVDSAAAARGRRDTAKPDVVYLHSAGGYRETDGLRLLADRFNILAVELPGIGPAATAPGLATLADYADDVDAVIAALDLDAYALLGLSFGGAVALWFAVLHRSPALTRVALESPAAFLSGRPRTAGPSGDRPHAYAVSAASDPTVLREGAAKLDLDVLVAFGTEDAKFPVETGRLYSERLPQAFVTFVYQAGHAISVDRPDAFAELFGDFLDRGAVFQVEERSSLILA